MKYTISKNGYYYKINNKGLKTRISKKTFLEKKGGAHKVYKDIIGNIGIKENHKTYKLQEEALNKAIDFYKEGKNKNLVCVFRKGLMTYKVIPSRYKNEFILISANNKYKYIKEIKNNKVFNEWEPQR